MNFSKIVDEALIKQRQDLIDATGYDTFEQAMTFIKEARDLQNCVDRPTPEIPLEESLRFEESMRDICQRQIDKIKKEMEQKKQ